MMRSLTRLLIISLRPCSKKGGLASCFSVVGVGGD